MPLDSIRPGNFIIYSAGVVPAVGVVIGGISGPGVDGTSGAGVGATSGAGVGATSGAGNMNCAAGHSALAAGSICDR